MFGRTPAATLATVTVQDGVVASAWGMTDNEWTALTDAERRDYRDRVVFAPYFNTEGK